MRPSSLGPRFFPSKGFLHATSLDFSLEHYYEAPLPASHGCQLLLEGLETEWRPRWETLTRFFPF